MPASIKLKRSPRIKRVSRRPLSIAAKLAILRAALLGAEPTKPNPPQTVR
jgi:hypothetical protein